jgi:Helix-turn-helix domain/Bacterial regulatory proteins, gntR family
VTAPKYAQAAAIVRAQVADGTLKPGQPAPSGAHLARLTGFSTLTCRRALRDLLTEGTLVPGPSRNACPRVAAPGKPGTGDAAALSRALAALRRAAGLSQPALAALTGYSTTTVGHAETGRYLGSPGKRLPRPVTARFVRSSLRGGGVVCGTIRDTDSRPQTPAGRYPSSLPLLTFPWRTCARQPYLRERDC